MGCVTSGVTHDQCTGGQSVGVASGSYGGDPPAARRATELFLPKDDLRAYAYEGDGSSSGSLTSAISGELTNWSTEIWNYRDFGGHLAYPK